MSRTASAREFVDYARAQIAAAEAILASHRAKGMTCSCGREYPCPVVASCSARRDHFVEKLALIEMTVELPSVKAVDTANGEGSRKRLGSMFVRFILTPIAKGGI